jgi:hypothetical protein
VDTCDENGKAVQTATQNESCKAIVRAALLLEAAPLYASTLKWRSQSKEKDHLMADTGQRDPPL